MYHAYKHGYSVLPGLRKLDTASPFLDTPADREFYRAAKREAVRQRPCCFTHDLTEALERAVCDFIVAHYPIALDPPHTLNSLAMQVQEDLAIVRRDGPKRDWIAALHVCLPSAWRPEEKIGQSFDTVHQVVPGMKLSNSTSLVDAMIHGGPFERYVWGVLFDRRLDGHPDRPRAPFNPAQPHVYVKIERQVTVGFPDHEAALFLIRPYLLDETEIDHAALAAGLRQMTPAQREYKNVAQGYDDLIAYLDSRS